MKCANCGEVLREGSLFCPCCGREIQIVPDYNEYDEDYLKAVLAEANLPASARRRQQAGQGPQAGRRQQAGQGPQAGRRQQAGQRQQEKKRRRRIRLCAFAAVVLLLVTGTTTAFLIRADERRRQENSFDYQVERAEEAQKSGDIDAAIAFYEKALSLDRENCEVRLALAEIHIIRKNYDPALILCQEVIQKDRANRRACELLIAVYEEQKNYAPVLALYDAVDVSLHPLFAPYLVAPPSFSLPPGTYDAFATLEITADRGSAVFYSLDGSNPVHRGLRYSSPIEMDENQKTYRVQAVCMNEKGIYSEVSGGEYRIDIPAPDMPIVSPDGGDFGVEIAITVTVPDACRAFYTWDGSDPDENSRAYTGPITIPEGNNVLSVILIDDTTGLRSDIFRGNYIFYREDEDEGEVLPDTQNTQNTQKESEAAIEG